MNFIAAALPAFSLAIAPLGTTTNTAPAPAFSRSVQQGYDHGWKDCAPALDKFVRFVYKDDKQYAMLGNWSPSNPNGSMFSSLTIGAGVMVNFSAAKNTHGTCDVAITEVILSGDNCDKFHDAQIKTWTYFDKLGA